MNSFREESWSNPPPEEIAALIRKTRTIAVVGLSSNPDRPAYRVAHHLIQAGYDIIPVNPSEDEVLGKKAYPDLSSIGRRIDLVDIFRRSEAVPPLVEEAVRIGAAGIWLQEGVVSFSAYEIARKAGVPIVMDLCLKKEHLRLESDGSS